MHKCHPNFDGVPDYALLALDEGAQAIRQDDSLYRSQQVSKAPEKVLEDKEAKCQVYPNRTLH